MTAPTKQHEALAFDCPFCKAVSGSPCVTRNSGHEQTWPHSRRIALTRTAEERHLYGPVRVNALCCECGNLRTVSNHHSKRDDPNGANKPLGRSKGWRFTQTLKCSACGGPTRHAVLRPADASYRDSDEEQQRIALGDPDTSRYGHLTDLGRIRREYREMPFPRNPNLRHRYWVSEAKAAWDDGSKKVLALCGEPMTVKESMIAEGRASKRERVDGYLIAEQFSDIEYEDHDTGLSWIDMDCVDCCRVSNAHYITEQRTWMEQLLAWFARRPERIEDHEVEGVIDALSRLLEARRNQSP